MTETATPAAGDGLPIAGHHRANHEQTNVELLNIRTLLRGAHRFLMAAPGSGDDVDDALGLLGQALDRVETLDHLRSIEWVGLGGRSDDLTAVEVARARGESGRAAA